jgi:hypothetical protein
LQTGGPYVFGGAYGDAAAGTGGTVFELSPNADKTIWTYKVLYNFCALANCADGQKPSAGVILDPSGKLYGAAENGGVDNHVRIRLAARLRHGFRADPLTPRYNLEIQNRAMHCR